MSPQKITTIDTEQVTSTEELMRGKNELIIIHSDQRYMLRITRNGKLILTK